MVYFFKHVPIMRFPGEAMDTVTLKPWAKYAELMCCTECQKSESQLHSFNDLFSRTTRVSQHQKSRTILVKPIWIHCSKR